MSSAVQLEMEPRTEALDTVPISEAEGIVPAGDGFALKQQVSELLATHRARRNGSLAAPLGPIPVAAPTKGRAAQIAATVAERYANSPTYRAFLAEEAENAIRKAEAAAEIAAVTARAVAAAQCSLLAELEQLATPGQAGASQSSGAIHVAPLAADVSIPASDTGTPAGSSASLHGVTVRLYEETRLPSLPKGIASNAFALTVPMEDEEERLALDEEIAFRQSPSFDEITTSLDIPANLIEFPRQLIAARKARPRIAEGPLRESVDEARHSTQLRIFEVEPAQISTAAVEDEAAPVWTSIMLGAQPAPQPFHVRENDLMAAPVLAVAPMELRLMAAAVDASIVIASTILFAGAVALTVGNFSPGVVTLQSAAISLAGAGALLGLLYQVLCFTLADHTPGMRYARIAFCTFSDENPTRRAMRRRILALILSACPMGIGILWAGLDGDGLGWHDRISRMYQRSY